MHTIAEHDAALAEGPTTARALVEECLARIADPAGEGARTFATVYADRARDMADAADARRRAGRARPHDGLPISLKDLFDVAGEPTPAGSRVLADAPPAAANATVVDRLLAAGFIPVGRTNMTEFAFSGLGINPHHGTPAAPWDRAARRIPGGSSSGAAVSVADGMACGAIGTDTGGSCRIPAAFCGVAGFKPTARRVPTAGVLPLSPSLDSVGPIAATAACCAALDAAMSGETAPAPRPVVGARLLAPTNVVLDGMAPEVGEAYEAALVRLAQAGAVVVRARLPAFDAAFAFAGRLGIVAAEAFDWHRALAAASGGRYDPRILARIMLGASVDPADLPALHASRAALMRVADAETEGCDAVVMPTVAILPPAIESLDDAAEYGRVNGLVLRNTSLANVLDRCAISLPVSGPRASGPRASGGPHSPPSGASGLPIGLSLMGETLGDARLLSLAMGVEAALGRSPS